MRFPLALVSLCVLQAAAAQDFKAVDAYVTQIMAKRGVPGISLAIVRDGKTIYKKGYGFADLENGVPATTKTVYEIGSVTKQFTAAIVMQLSQEGKVDLEASASKYLPDLPAAWNGVTVRHLLTHTSGIKSYTDVDGFEGRMREPMTSKDLLALIAPIPPDFSPGADWKYNNSGYYLLGMLIENVTGKSYRDNLKARIFGPLGMTATDVNVLSTLVKGRARGYMVDPIHGATNAMVIDMSWPGAAGSLISTVEDLAKWDSALYGDRIASQKNWAQAWSPVKLTNGKTAPYGFGWALGAISGTAVVEHGGDIPGFNADILRIPSKKLTVIALCNCMPGISGIVTKNVAGIVDPTLKVSVSTVRDDDPKATVRHREIVMALMAGTLSKDPFTPEVRARLFPDTVVRIRALLSRFGSTIDSFKLVKSESKDGMTMRTYLVSIGGQDINVMFAMLPNGKIGGFSMTPA